MLLTKFQGWLENLLCIFISRYFFIIKQGIRLLSSAQELLNFKPAVKDHQMYKNREIDINVFYMVLLLFL